MTTKNVHSRERIARRKAFDLGLTMRRHAGQFTLADQHGDIMTAPLSAVEECLAAHWTARRPGPRRARVPASWSALIDAYCAWLASSGQTAATIRLRHRTLAQIARGLGKPPAAVTGDDLVNWFAHQEHWSRETRRNNRSTVRGFLAWAYEHSHVTEYLGNKLPSVRMTPPAPRPVPDPIISAALESCDLRTALMLRLASEAGLRRAEVAGVRTDDVTDTAGGCSLIVRGKGDKTRTVPISAALGRRIRAGAAGHTPGAPAHGWLFPAPIPDQHLTPEHVGAMVGCALPPGYTMHKLRHRYATTAYRASRNLRAVQTLLGHASVATTERYTAVDDDEIRQAAMAAMMDD